MPLINKLNDTRLRSLKYGNDLPSGGSSNQPYIQTDINKVDNTFNRIRLSRFDDGLVRGGAIGAINASVTDTIRISKFLTDFPKGPMFILKQVGLQLSNPRIESKKINPLNPVRGGVLGNIINAGINIINRGLDVLNDNGVGPTRIYNLGINTLAQVPVNAFGGHITRHGLLPFTNDNNKYSNVIINNDKNNGKYNRLNLLREKFNIKTDYKSTNALNADPRGVLSLLSNLLDSNILRTNFNFNNILSNPNNDNIIDDYMGGPDSTYGIGRTTIRRYTNTVDVNKVNLSLERSQQVTKDTKIKSSIINTPLNKKYSSIKNQLDKQQKVKTKIQPVQKVSGNKLKTTDKFFTSQPVSIFRDNKTFNYIGNGGKLNVHNRNDYDILTIGFSPVNPFTGALKRIIFSAYISNFRISSNPSYNTIKYVGRAEEFYIYTGFNRSVSFNLDVPCYNKEQLFEKHRALGELESICAGKYGQELENVASKELLGGIITVLNIGRYLINEPTVLTGISYEIPNENWDIDARLAQVIKVSVTANIIHKELPEFRQGGYYHYLPDLNSEGDFISGGTSTPDKFDIVSGSIDNIYTATTGSLNKL